MKVTCLKVRLAADDRAAVISSASKTLKSRRPRRHPPEVDLWRFIWERKNVLLLAFSMKVTCPKVHLEKEKCFTAIVFSESNLPKGPPCGG